MDLRSEEAYWLIRNGLIAERPPLDADARCDVLVVGAGVSGALIAERLTRCGFDVIVVDRRCAGAGSTAATTALLLYDIDRPLHDLAGAIGETPAARVFHAGLGAIDELDRLCGGWPDVGFARRPSLWVAQPDDAAVVERECEARLRHGFDVRPIDREALRDGYGIDRPAAMWAAGEAEVDPYRLTHRLLALAESRGARVYDRVEIAGRWPTERGVGAATTSGVKIDAGRLIYATGFEAEQIVGAKFVKLSSTFAMASEPFLDLTRWAERALIWETGDPYLYLRTTPEGRVIVGGEDEPYKNATRRDRALAKKVDAIIEKLRAMMPWLRITPEFAWAGTFGQTHDGLPYIGPHPAHPGCLFALGYGGNGITFSTIAARILADLCRDQCNDDAPLFAFDRPTAGRG